MPVKAFATNGETGSPKEGPIAPQKPSQQRPKSANGPRGNPSLKAWYSQKAKDDMMAESGSQQSTPRSERDLMDGFRCTPRSTAVGGAVCPASLKDKRPQTAGPSRPSANLQNLPGSPGFGLKQKVRELEARMAKDMQKAQEEVELAKQERLAKGAGLSRVEAEALVGETKREILESFDQKRNEFAKFWVQQNVDNKRFNDQLNEIRNGNSQNQSRLASLQRRISELATECGVGVEYDDDLRAISSEWGKQAASP